MTTLTDFSPLTDTELSQRLGAALLDASPDLLALEAERQRRLAEAAHTRLAAAERQRRQKEADAIERDRLLDTLIKQRDDYRRRFVETLHRLAVTTPSDVGPLIEEAYILGRQGYALGHDLAGVTGDRQRFEMRWDVPDQITLCGGAPGAAFVAGLRGHPLAVQSPWRADVEMLHVLMPPVEGRIGNGG